MCVQPEGSSPSGFRICVVYCTMCISVWSVMPICHLHGDCSFFSLAQASCILVIWTSYNSHFDVLPKERSLATKYLNLENLQYELP